MAAPADINVQKLDGKWIMNQDLSADYDSVLELQGVPWIMRKILNVAKVTLIIKAWDESDVTHMSIESKPGAGLPSSTENRVFNNEPVETEHPLFGKVRSQTRWTTAAELDGVDESLVKDFEPGTLAYVKTEHLNHEDVVTQQTWGFETIDGTRFHTRHVVVSKGETVVRVKVVYDYLGPRDA